MTTTFLRPRPARRRCPAFLFGTLLVCLGCGPAREERPEAIHQLAVEPTEENLLRVRQSLADPDRDVRATALFSLAEAGAPDTGTIALALLDDPDARVRTTAARLLGELGDAAAHAGPLVDHLLGDPDPNVRRRAAESLGMLGGETAVAGLARALGDPVQHVRLAAVDALALHEPAVATEALSQLLLADPVWEIRVSAAQALGGSGDPAALAGLAPGLEDANEYVRAAAGAGLRRLRAAGVQPPAEVPPVEDGAKTEPGAGGG